MLIVYLFSIFESFFFPRNNLFENRSNPAILSRKQSELIIGAEQRFGLTDLRTYTIYSQLKSYSLGITSFGNRLYREHCVDLGFGFPIIENLGAGANIAMLNYWVKDYYSKFAYTVKIGGLFQTTKAEFGIWFSNINSPKFSDIDYLPPGYSLCFGYLITNDLSFNFTIREIEDELPFFKFGLIYSPYKIVQFTGDVNTEPLLFEYGLKINLGEFSLNYSGSIHRRLGLSHAFYLIFAPQ